MGCGVITGREHEERALHFLALATSPNANLYEPDGAEKFLRKARAHLEAARILKALEDLHR